MIHVDNDIALKELELIHAKDIFNTINTEREYLREWLPFVDETLRPKDSEAFVNFSMLNAKEKGEYVYAIFYYDTFAGLIGFRGTEIEARKTEIGYWLSEKYQKKGIIIRSCKALINYAFNEWGMEKVNINVATKNFKSQRIPEKLGFLKEKIIENGELLVSGYADIIVYSLKKQTNSESTPVAENR